MTCVGVASCSGGWFAAVADGEVRTEFHERIDDLWEAHRGAERLLVGVPIGLPEAGPRPCDERCRELLGAREGPAPPTPARIALGAETYEEASLAHWKATGTGLPERAWELVPKIRELDALLEADAAAAATFWESDPELCFYGLNGGRPLGYGIGTERGRERRLALLEAGLPGAGGAYESALEATPRRRVGRDDVLAALALAATAREGNLLAVPEDLVHDRAGRPMAKVYPDPATAAD